MDADKVLKTVCLMVVLNCLLMHRAFSQLDVDAEADIIASVPYNKVRIPAAGGSPFDLAQDMSIGERHVLSAAIQRRC